MSESSFKQGVFRRIHRSERKRILSALGQYRTPISFKGSDEEVYNVMSTSLYDDSVIVCKVVPGNKKPALDQNVVVNLTFGYERYFFQGFLKAWGDDIAIDASADFYVLQRRKSARLSMPSDFPCGFNIIGLHGKTVFFELRIMDFSSGGLKVFLPVLDPVVNTGEVITGVLHLGIRRPLTMDAIVRHVIRRETGDHVGQVLGLQFDPSNKIMEVKLLTVFMDVQREIFIKYSK